MSTRYVISVGDIFAPGSHLLFLTGNKLANSYISFIYWKVNSQTTSSLMRKLWTSRINPKENTLSIEKYNKFARKRCIARKSF